jgi:hypothetical protein
MSENPANNQCQEKRGRCEFLNIIAWLTLILQSNRAEPSVSPISFKIETVTFCWDAPAGPRSATMCWPPSGASARRIWQPRI